MGKYRIEVVGHQFGEFINADIAVKYLLKRGWKHPNKSNHWKLRLKTGDLKFEASIVFVQLPKKLSDLPKIIRKKETV